MLSFSILYLAIGLAMGIIMAVLVSRSKAFRNEMKTSFAPAKGFMVYTAIIAAILIIFGLTWPLTVPTAVGFFYITK